MLKMFLILLQFYLAMLKLFWSLLLFSIAYARALFTALHVHLLGLYYVLAEFFVDCQTGLKTTREGELVQAKLRQWKAFIQKSRGELEEGEEENPRQLVAVITGADGTIGSEVLSYLLALDFKVIAVGSKAPAIGDNPCLKFIKCDLSARNEVFEALESVHLACEQVDLLVLNAALMLYPGFGWLPYKRDILGSHIVERHFAVNVLANAQLFASLAGRLERSLLHTPRAVFLSSCTAHAGDVSLLLRDEERFWCRHLNGYKAYADSKLLLSAYVKYLARVLRSKSSRIGVASLHPGIVPGSLYRNVFAPLRYLINSSILAPIMRSPRQAATFVLDLAFSESFPEDGAYHENGEPVPLKGTEDPEQVWMMGKCVREMIVDNDGLSFFSVSSQPAGRDMANDGLSSFDASSQPEREVFYDRPSFFSVSSHPEDNTNDYESIPTSSATQSTQPPVFDFD